jgi:hypothetical protein
MSNNLERHIGVQQAVSAGGPRVRHRNESPVLKRDPQTERQMFANGWVTDIKQVDTNKWVCTLRTGQRMELSAPPNKMPWAIGYQT